MRLYTGETTDGISTANDGENTTVTLFAGSSATIGGVPVNAFRFEHFNADIASWVTIGTVNATDPTNVSGGIGVLEWANPPGNANQINDLRVHALDINGNILGTDANGNIVNEVDNNTNEAVSLTGAQRAPIGVFENQVVVNGQSTDLPDVDARVGGPTVANGSITATQTGPAVGGLFPWAARISAAGNLPDASNEIVVQADINDGDGDTSDVVQAYTTYNQIPTNVTVSVAPGDSANVSQPGNQSTTYIIKVTDQNGAIVAGVDVHEVQPDGSDFNAGVGTDDDGTTDVLGEFDTDLNEATMDLPFFDQDPAAGIQGTYYWIDLNNNGTFQNGPDKIVKITQSNIPQAPATIEIVSSLGNVMDADERTDLTFTVKDANGDPVQNAGINGTIDRDVADNTPADSSTPFAVVTNAQGQFTLANQQLGIDGNKVDVTVNAAAGAATNSLAVETDEAVITWDEYPTAQELATTDTVQHGVAELPSGSDLPNRTVGISLIVTGNALFSPQAEQPAGTTRGGDLIASAVTDANGGFSVKIDDPALPNGQELNDIVRGSANDAATGFHINGATDCPPPIAGLPNCVDLDLDWLRTLDPTRVEIHNDVNGNTADGLRPGLDPTALLPGGLGIGEVVAFNADNIELDDVDVNLTIDEGFFVKIDDAFENVAIGNKVDFKSAGQTLTVNTGEIIGAPGIGNGQGAFLANIERHEGFDADGLVEDEIHATAGAATDEHDMTWTTRGTPINPRDTNPLVVELSADQESSVLPKARAGNVQDSVDAPPFDGDGSGQVVDYDVSTWDQFGNPTRQNTVTDDSNPLSGFAGGAQSDFALFQPAIRAFADSATDQSLEVELEGERIITYTDNPNDSSFDPGNPLAFLTIDLTNIEENTAPINWYNVNFDASTFTLEQEGPEQVEVGTVVTEVVEALDQEGQPIENMRVDFLRGGPGNADDDTCNEDLLNLCQATDGNGEAFYDFVGGTPGTASVSAVLYSAEGVRIVTVGPDTVQFVGVTSPQVINATLKSSNLGKRKDLLEVNAPKLAKGAKVVVQKKVNGKWKTIGKAKRLDNQGDRSFSVRDRNGSKVTKYRAVISANANIRREVTKIARQK